MSTEMTTVTQVLVANERRQSTIADASEALAIVANAVRASGKKGTVTIKMTLSPDKHDESALNFDADVDYKAPKRPKPPAIIYQNPNGSFTKDDPRQLELLAEQEAEKAATRERLAAEGVASLERVGRG